MIRLEGGQRAERGQPPLPDGHPLVSIITVSYNAEAHLSEAIESVLSQTFGNVEYIIVDGASNDRTLSIIRSYGDAITYWISEPDDGIYQAMNKGIALATGEIIGLVNADDVIYPDTLTRVVTVLKQNPDAGFTMAPVDLATENGTVFGVALPLTNNELPARKWREMPCPHQGVYVRNHIYQCLGGFREHYRLSADYDFLLRLLQKEIPFVRIDDPVGFFRLGGKSGGMRTWLEVRQLLVDYGRSRVGIEWRFMTSVLKMVTANILPHFLFKKVKKINRRSKRKLY